LKKRTGVVRGTRLVDLESVKKRENGQRTSNIMLQRGSIQKKKHGGKTAGRRERKGEYIPTSRKKEKPYETEKTTKTSRA